MIFQFFVPSQTCSQFRVAATGFPRRRGRWVRRCFASRFSASIKYYNNIIFFIQLLACLVFFVLIVGLFIYVYTLMNSRHTSTSDDNSANFGKALAEQRSHFGEEQAKFQEGFDRARAKIEETMSGWGSRNNNADADWSWDVQILDFSAIKNKTF